MKKTLILFTLICLALCLSLPASLAAVDSVPMDENDPLVIDLPEGWIKMDVDLSSSTIMGYTPAAMYDCKVSTGICRAFVLHMAGFYAPITLQQVTSYLAAEGISASPTQLNGTDALQGYVPSLGVYGAVLLDQDATGYYIIGVVPGTDGDLAAQKSYVQAFFSGVRLGDQPAEDAEPEGADAAPSSPGIAELQASLDAVRARIAETQARMEDLTAEMAQLQAILDADLTEEAELLQALSQVKCPYCGFEYPEGSTFKFCPQCGAER